MSSLRLTLLVLLSVFFFPCADACSAQSIKRGKWRAKHVPKGWVLFHTRHYQVQSQVPEDEARKIADHLESMMRFYRKLVPTSKKLKQFVLKIFKDRENYIGYGASKGSVAYYSESARELVCYDTGNVGGVVDDDAKANPDAIKRYKEVFTEVFGGDPPPALEVPVKRLASMDLLGVLSHEGWHQYFHFFIVSKVQFPAWLDEGLGDYFFTVKPDGKGGFERGHLMPQRFLIIQNAIRSGEHVPIHMLLEFRQRQYYENPSLCYAQGWSMVHFVFHGGHDRYKDVIKKLLTRFKDCHDMDEATQYAFRRINVKRFEKDWKEYYLNYDVGKELYGVPTAEVKERIAKRKKEKEKEKESEG